MRFGELYSVVYVLNLIAVITMDYFAWNALKQETTHTTWKSASKTAFWLFAGQTAWFFVYGMLASSNAAEMPNPPVLF